MDKASILPEVDHQLATPHDLAAMPWRFAEAVHDWQVAWFRRMTGFCFCSSYPSHPHEPPDQLEIPDPIEEAGEDLFA